MEKNRLEKLKEIYAKISTPEERLIDLMELFEDGTFKGEPGHTPTEKELMDLIRPMIPTSIDGEDGHTPTVPELEAIIKPLIPAPLPGVPGKPGKPGNNGSPDTAYQLIEKIKSAKGKKRLSIYDLKDIEHFQRERQSIQWAPANGGAQGTGGVTLTTNGSGGAATLVGSVLNIPIYTAGGAYTAGAGLTLTTNQFSVNTTQNITTLSNLGAGIVQSTSGGVLSSAPLTSGQVTTALGFTPYNGTTNPNGYTSNVTGQISAGTNVTITGAGTTASPYVINSSGSGGAVTSVFGRTGVVVATSGDYTTAQVTESGNLYFTNARAQAAISLTTTGTSGAATFTGGTLNIPQYSGGGTTSPGGSNTQVQFNDSGAFGGVAGMVFNKTTNVLTITGAVDASTAGYFSQNGTRILMAQPSLFNTYVGNSGSSAATGNYNVSIGDAALTSLTSGFWNIGIGAQTLNAVASGFGNVAIGYQTLKSTTGNGSTAVGTQVLSSTTGSDNTGMGYNAVQNITSGGNNTGIGSNAGIGITTGAGNTYIGRQTGLQQQTGSNNVAIGYQAALGNSINYNGSNDTFIGSFSGYNVATGSQYNAFLGYNAGKSLTTGTQNTWLGAAINNANLTTGSQNIVIGYDLSLPSATASGQLDIANFIYGTGLTGTGTTISGGSIGLGLNAPTAVLHLKAGTATASSAPLKFTSGINLTTPEDGAIEYNGTHFYGTIGTTRYQLDQQTGGGGSGTVTSASVVSANGFAGTVATATTTPAITITTSITGLLKGNGTAISAATAGTDYTTPTDTETMTNKRVTKRVLALSANSAAPAINTDSYDVVHITGQTATITGFTMSGTPVDGDTLRISITGTASVPFTPGTSFENSGTVTMPTTTTGTTRLDLAYAWNTETSKWRAQGYS
jgi:hypothetical protein